VEVTWARQFPQVENVIRQVGSLQKNIW
jgi:hypothetical protein